jgi:endonuclease YncB( thermonuclease family)
MKKLFLSLLFLFPTVAFANPYDFKVKRVIDGDTVVIEAPFLPKELGDHISVRILGVDTPEKAFRAKCELENTKGVAATLFTDNEVHAAKEIKVVLKGWDKYGGRALGDVILDGVPLSMKLIQKGYAVPYSGKGKKKDWCNE